jgi:hypothetical protein
MSPKTRSFLIVVAILVVAGAVALLLINPPHRTNGGLGGIMSNLPAYLEEYQCLGVKKDFCPPWPDYGCDNLCYGVIYGKQCYMTGFEDGELYKNPTECR